MEMGLRETLLSDSGLDYRMFKYCNLLLLPVRPVSLRRSLWVYVRACDRK